MPRISRLGPLRWLMLLDLARVAYEHFDEHLHPHDRKRVVELARKSKGDPRRLSTREKDDLKQIARRLELTRLGRTVGPTLLRGRRGSR